MQVGQEQSQSLLHLFFPSSKIIREPKHQHAVGVLVSPLEEKQVTSFTELSLLDSSERQRMRTLKRAGSGFLKSRVLLRTQLSDMFPQLGLDEWQFERQPEGQWKIKNPLAHPCYVSTSRTHQAVATSVSQDYPVAVDIECVDTKPLKPIDAALTRSEKAEIESYPKPLQCERALRIWSAKECFTKLMEKGPLVDPQKLEVSGDSFQIRYGENEQMGRFAVVIKTQLLDLGNKAFIVGVAALCQNKQFPSFDIQIF